MKWTALKNYEADTEAKANYMQRSAELARARLQDYDQGVAKGREIAQEEYRNKLWLDRGFFLFIGIMAGMILAAVLESALR